MADGQPTGKLTEVAMLRLDAATMTRIERATAEMESRAGVRVSRPDVIRRLVATGLDAVERELGLKCSG